MHPATYVCVLVLVATVGAEVRGQAKSLNTEKRALGEGEAGLKKRAPALSTASSPLNAGVEYADTKQQLADKSPSQRAYPSPEPQIAKFSDLLAGQAPSFQAAIASQLFAPISVYQPRSGTSTTYEVSAPVPSQLAYSENYQQPNAVQYTPRVYSGKDSRQQEISQPQLLAQAQQIYNQPIQQAYQQFPQVNYQQSIDYNQIQPVQYQPQQYKQLDNQQALSTAQYQQSPKAVYSDNQQNVIPAQYTLAPQAYFPEQQLQQQAYVQQQPQQQAYVQQQPQQQAYVQQQPQQQAYVQQQPQQQAYVQQQPVQNVQYVQPAVTYARQEDIQQNLYNQPELKSYVKQQPVAQNYQAQPQGPVSFASFSLHQPTQSIIHHPYHQQNVQQAQYSSSQAAPLPSQGHLRQLSYFRQGPQLQIAPQAQQPQPQLYQQAQSQSQFSGKLHPGYTGQVAAAPVFPAVQYFGKYAQSIFNKN